MNNKKSLKLFKLITNVHINPKTHYGLAYKISDVKHWIIYNGFAGKYSPAKVSTVNKTSYIIKDDTNSHEVVYDKVKDENYKISFNLKGL